ncbi:Ras GTPase [Acrasis kona]
MMGNDGFVLVIDSTCLRSLVELHEFVERLKHIKGDVFPCVLVCNKIDLTSERTITIEEVRSYSVEQLNSCPVVETSARTRTNVDQIFYQIVKQMRYYDDNVVCCDEETEEPTYFSVPIVRKKLSSLFKSVSEEDPDIELFL